MLLSRAEIKLHRSVENYLKKRDEKKERQCEIQATAESKLRRQAKLRETIQKEIEADKKQKKDDKTYTSSSGIDLKEAEKAVEEAMKAKRTKDRACIDPLTKRCRYFPYYCDGAEHQSAASPKCKMHAKSKTEREDALKKIKEILVGEHIKNRVKVRPEIRDVKLFNTVLIRKAKMSTVQQTYGLRTRVTGKKMVKLKKSS